LKYIEIHMSLKEGKLMSAYTGYSRVTQTDYIRVHPGFGNLKAGQDMIHDIALLHSGEKLDLKYADEITPEPACLPMPEFCARDGDHVVVSGWGKTLDNSNGQAEVLQTADLYLENHLNCQNKFTFPYVQAITDDMVCAMGMNGEDSCQGDSGGPLMINNDDVATLYGVVSWGVKCGGDHPGVYTRVSKYVDWIEKSTKGKDQIIFGNDKEADVTPCTEPFKESDSELTKTCGNPEYGRIETNKVEIFNYPWYYLIQACKSRACVTRACPATLISKNFLLTAASCVSWVNGEKAEGVLVSRDITDEMVANGPNVNLMALGVSKFDVSTEITMHPNLDLRSAKNNLALIKLTHKLLPGKDVPICLPTADGFCLNAMDKKSSMLESLVIGDKDGFEMIDIQVNREAECNRWYGIDFPKDTVCGSGQNGKDTCLEDRGVGAWHRVNNNQSFLYAITNVGSSDCTGTIPRLYTRVTEHLKWIYTVTGGEAGDPRNPQACDDSKSVTPVASPWKQSAKKATRTAKKPLGRTVNASWFPNSLKGDKTTTTTLAPKTTIAPKRTTAPKRTMTPPSTTRRVEYTPPKATARPKPQANKNKNKGKTNTKCRGRRRKKCLRARQGKYNGRRG